jgi:hypothetical protein
LVENLSLPSQIAVDDANVYFATLDGIFQVPKNALGATPILLSSNDRQPLSLASDGAYVYWNDTLDPQAIRRIVVGGNGATTLAAIGAGGVALGPTTLFWVGNDGVQSMPKEGGAVTTLGPAPMGGGFGVALDANDFYYAASPSSFSATIYRIPQSGGASTPVATVGTNVNVLTTDGTNLYFVSGDDLDSVPAAGGAVSTLANGFSASSSPPSAPLPPDNPTQPLPALSRGPTLQTSPPRRSRRRAPVMPSFSPWTRGISSGAPGSTRTPVPS